MDELIDNEFARKSDSAGSEGKIDMYRIKGVLNPNKGKIMFVFDCSSQYKGTLIIQNSFSGPDLTTQLVGILHRFKLEPVSFMADIQVMYHQMKVPESQRSYLRYPW